MATASYCDAHVHLAHPDLREQETAVWAGYREIGLQHAVVVGTSPADWAEVRALCSGQAKLLPAVGLHPWAVNTAPPDWRDAFLNMLGEGVRIIGEFGLDQWIEDHDLERQAEAFRWQFQIAAERNLPTSIHCLKAHQPMLEILRAVERPDRGFALHAYNGPESTIDELVEMGALFSVNSGQLKPNARRVRELIQRLPEDRLLVETDAPDFLPPEDFREFTLNGESDGRPLCHPANLRRAYSAIAEIPGL